MIRTGYTDWKTLTGSASGYHVLSSKAAKPQTVLHNLSTDPSVLSAEPDKPIRLPGIKAAATVYPASAPATGLRISSTPIRYYSSYAASGYVNQPATGVINLDKAQNLATGRGAVVATIDTGADFSHSVLQNSLVWGYDFAADTNVDMSRFGGKMVYSTGTKGAINNGKALVEGVQTVKRHTRPNPQKQIKGGIAERERPIAISNLMVVCPTCGPQRVGHKVETSGGKAHRIRICRKCGAPLETKK